MPGLLLQKLFRMRCRAGLQAWDVQQDVQCQAVAIDMILDRQLERRTDVALLAIAVDMEVGVVTALVAELVYQ
ncbi:hypothetical protein D3C85_1095970 [compost metagenome]